MLRQRFDKARYGDPKTSRNGVRSNPLTGSCIPFPSFHPAFGAANLQHQTKPSRSPSPDAPAQKVDQNNEAFHHGARIDDVDRLRRNGD